ncbi:caspase, EACC1-associated type [Nostoc sp. UIC 10890]
MAKVALLIGVSEYEPGLTPLPAATKDVEAMQRVLLHPEIGGFDDVTLLLNPQQHQMAVAIETLFDGRQKDDLLVLFFSGHGIKDESGKLYFASRNTHKTLIKSTTVPASFVHEVMSNSRSRREVVILDCCFSGAFAEGMSAKDHGFVDIRNQLGGEGRAVLTSSTSTQYSFEQQGADTSTYTRYIVEGLETGAADRDEDGWISVDELHEYASKKVQEVSPAMKPEIYAIKEGYKINLGKAPIDNRYLRYRREVEYWVEGGNGEISFTGRAALEELRNRLELTTNDTNEIETQVLEPIKIYKHKLQQYEQVLCKEIEVKFPLSDKALTDLKRFQQVLGLTDESIALIEASIIAKQQTHKNPISKHILISKSSNIWNYIGVGIIGTIIGGILVAMFRPQPVFKSCPVDDKYILGDKISVGEEILLTQDTNPDKKAGVEAFADGDCQNAIKKLESYRNLNLTDPEALIYLNNAKAVRRGEPLKIAVSVPIGTNSDVAKEMLRGVAQAQDEVNRMGGIDSKLLKVAIANDDNDPSTAVLLATRFVKDASILAVVGHNSSNASLSAAPVYQKDGLVMMSPTSYAPNLSNVGNYIFRTAPSVNSVADSVSNYAVNIARKTNFLMCVDPQSLDNLLFKDRFIKAIKAAGGQINSTNCNISTRNFDPKAVTDQAIRNGANALVLAIYIERIKEGLAVARTTQGQLEVFSSSTLFRNDILEEGEAIKGMIIAIPWHSQAFPENPFEENAKRLWGGTVNWRTATSYDATKAIIVGLQPSKTRHGLQEALHSQRFSVDGATGKIQFLASGDRKDNPMFLVKVQQRPGTDKYEFVPIQP